MLVSLLTELHRYDPPGDVRQWIHVLLDHEASQQVDRQKRESLDKNAVSFRGAPPGQVVYMNVTHSESTAVCRKAR